MSDNTESTRIIQTSSPVMLMAPVYVGYWDFKDGEIRAMTKTKPSPWKRFWFNFFFGIKWFPKA